MIVWFSNTVNGEFRPPHKITTFKGTYYEAAFQDLIDISWDTDHGRRHGSVYFQNQISLDKYRDLLISTFGRIYSITTTQANMFLVLK
jgi:tRNA 2-selenouridine synthase SelU